MNQTSLSSKPRKRFVIWVGLLLAVAALISAYYVLYGREFKYTFSEAQLQTALSARMPIEKTYLLLFQVTLDRPRVQLVDGSRRVNAGLDVALNLKIGESPVPLSGTVDASGGIRYDRSDGKFYLTDPKIERLQVQGLPEKYATRVSSALTLALAEYYTSHPIYSLDTLKIKDAAAKLVLKSVLVENRQVVVTLGIGP